eukprot:TRINITY_DN1970_c0_g1_i1.p1 TRINITY_DN1970_c0_g1~~TRINITY_DN1970_c0_g1_i1.p1  ORF type:complete len:112 (-),score=62.79 TRINITY_DN1970_c0_g1_i1:9-344(-)
MIFLFFFLMIRRPPRSTQSRSSAASDVYKRQRSSWCPSRCSLQQRCGLRRSRSSNRKPSRLTWRLPRLQQSTSRPVSYTHLRAHETVLDLVCRLLLEKKKNTKIKHRELSE